MSVRESTISIGLAWWFLLLVGISVATGTVNVGDPVLLLAAVGMKGISRAEEKRGK